MGERIIHDGIVDHMTADAVFVRILSKSACSECHSKSMCSVSEMTEKLIEVKQNATGFTNGELVNVILDRSLGNKAVLLGYFIPFLILIFTLILSSAFLSELWAGLLSLALLVPYYLVLYLLKERLSKTFHFRIEKI